MKFLNDSTYNEMKEKADHFDRIVDTVLENSESIQREDVTADSIIEAMQNENPETENSELQTQLDTATARVAELETELETSNARVAELEQELDETPAEQPATITAKGESSGEDMNIAKFADKNKGDTEAILAQAQKEGLI